MSARVPLPPGPKAPPAWQTVEWVARPTALLRRCAERYGDPFTLRTAWADAPMVFVSDPGEIKRIFQTGPDVLRAGASASFLEPFAGPNSILVLDGDRHLRQRKLMLPPFHGERMHAYKDLIAGIAEEEVSSWRPGEVVRTHERMQELTLEIIMRAVFGISDRAELETLRAEIRRTLDMTVSLPRMVAMSLFQRDLGPHSPWGSFRRAVEAVDALLADVIDKRRAEGAGDSILSLLLEARDEDGNPPSDRELRDQLVTLLAAGHETTAGSLGWCFERLARHPRALKRLRDELAAGDDTYLDAVIKEVMRIRPVLSIVPRKLVAPFEVCGYSLPPGIHVTPSIYLVHRRGDLYEDPLAFRPERWLGEDQPESYAWIPFGGGIRRCLGAAFATMEMREVLRVVVPRVDFTADGAPGERARRRSITLTPGRGGRVRIAAPAATTA